MTEEQLERANKLTQSIKHRKEQLEKRLPQQKSRSELNIISSGDYLAIPVSIKDTVLLLIENEYKKEIEKLEKEFKEL